MKTLEKDKTMEYEDAPSGSIFFYNYKEPLIPFEGGHGFEGALVYDATSEKIQCHFCGKWYETLGNHLAKEHNMTAVEYKEKVGLNKNTALINEKYRASLIASGQERFKNLRPGQKKTQAEKNKISATLKQNRMELKNLHGTCPAQLIDRLVALYNKLKRTPKIHTEVGFKEALLKTYGSFENACRIAGIPYREPGTTVASQYMKANSREKTVAFVREFYDETQRLPKGTEIPKSVARILAKEGRRDIFRDALSRDGVFKPVSFKGGLRYSNEELLDFLRIFKQVNGRNPSASDCRRKLLPAAATYAYRFGSWKQAIALAFLSQPTPIQYVQETVTQ